MHWVLILPRDLGEWLHPDSIKEVDVNLSFLIRWRLLFLRIRIIPTIDVAHSRSLLSQFIACPRKGHYESQALHVFGYLTKRPNQRVVANSRNPILYREGEDALDLDFTKESWGVTTPWFHQGDGRGSSLIDQMETTIFVDSDHSHNKVWWRCSITGIIFFVSRTLQ